MLFNIYNGQVRFSSIQTGSKPIFRPKRPWGQVSMGAIKGVKGEMDHSGGYKADALGNIDVVIHKHIDTMIGLGFPIYDGNGKLNPVPKDDLIHPNMDPNSSYWRRINEAKNLRR